MIDPKAIAVVGVGAVLPDAPDAPTFWNNIKSGRNSIIDVPSDRWRTDLYYDPNPNAPDKTYTKLGAWVQGFNFDPVKLGIPIPPRVLSSMDESQKWSLVACNEALKDYGYPSRAIDPTRMGVILGVALGGEIHYRTVLRINIPEIQDALSSMNEFQNLPLETQIALLGGIRSKIEAMTPTITEDTIPGEIGNIIAGRVANIYNFRGPNYVSDAACASTHAAVENAIAGLIAGHYDAVLTGGVDHTMGPDAFIKFCKIGALSPDGSRPYAEGANGFVMGEGAAIFVLKRLEDAESNGDKIYAVIRGIGGSSDGKGKGITAPNPAGQQLAIERAWQNAGLSPSSVGLIEGHGTSTAVGDVAEVEALKYVFGNLGLPVGKIALGSIKSNIGHLKGAAGAVGILKTIFALYEGVLPPSINCEHPNPALDFEHAPFAVNTTLRDWLIRKGEIRRAGVSSFGFGGTNFHMVMEEHIPGLLTSNRVYVSMSEEIPIKRPQATIPQATAMPTPKILSTVAADVRVSIAPIPYQGLLFIGAETVQELRTILATRLAQVRKGSLPTRECPSAAQVGMNQRLVIDYLNSDELIKRVEKAEKALEADDSTNWQAYTAQGIYRGQGKPGKVVFMFPGQGSQYINMLQDLATIDSVVSDTFKEADQAMLPILGKPLTSYIFIQGDEATITNAEGALKNTEITQPAMLTANVALLRLMAKFGFRPDFVIGHSLGEYAALVASGVLSFADALQIVSTRGRAMTAVSGEDNGCMAAVSGPLTEVEKILKDVEGYVVIANINSPVQSVIGGETKAVEKAIQAFQSAGIQAVKIPVSHAFHTKIVAPASESVKAEIRNKTINAPTIPVIANVTGEQYPSGKEEIIELLGAQVAAPVQFVKSMQTLYAEGARVFVEIGPKRVLSLLAMDNLKDKKDVTVLATNHPRKGGPASFSEALCGLYAAGVNGEGSIQAKGEAKPPASISATPGMSSQITKVLEKSPVEVSEGGLEEEITKRVIALISEKTGYPKEILELDLDLEADLGIDTVKQAEIFATVREIYNIPRRDDLRLSDYNTLRKVIGFMVDGVQSGGSQVVTPLPVTPEDELSKKPEIESALGSEATVALKAPTVVIVSPPPDQTIPLEARKENQFNEIKKHVLEVVSEKTGYPVEMLELDLDLEADLGIDTVKQAELFATIRQHYDIPRREDLRLADFNTLRKVIGFMQEAMLLSRGSSEATQPLSEPGEITVVTPDLNPPLPATKTDNSQLISPQPVAEQTVVLASKKEEPVVDTPVIVRRVPIPVLLPSLDYCSTSNISLDGDCRVLVVNDHGKVGNALARLLHERKVQVLTIDADQNPENMGEQVSHWLQEGPIHGIYFLPALDSEPPLADLSNESWKSEVSRRSDALFVILQSIPQKPFLVSATRMGGYFGYRHNDGTGSLGGVTSGLTKAVASERPDILVKVVDFRHDANEVFIASRLAAETLRDPSTIEVGWDGDLRYGVTVHPKNKPDGQDISLDAGSIFLISGGTAGIIAPVVLDLAETTKGSFYLLNRNPLPNPDDPYLARVKADRDGLLKELIKQSSPDNLKEASIQAEAKLAALERCAAAYEMQQKVTALGGKVNFLTCDVLDVSAVNQAVTTVVQAEGKVDFFIHAAGMDRSRRLEMKPRAEFHQILAVKADGFFNIYHSLLESKAMPKAMVFFTSVSGRFGNTGQTDYSAGNDLLCKLAYNLPLQHPGLKCIALDWSAWAEVGMASRGGYPKLMKYAGVDLLKPQEAAPLVREEILAPTSDHEMIMAGSLGPLTNLRRPDGGFDVHSGNELLKRAKPSLVMLGEVKQFNLHEGLTITTGFDPKGQPFLKDHALNGIPLFPGVMGMEGFSEASRFLAVDLSGSKQPIEVCELTDVHFLAACKFYRDKPRLVTWKIRPFIEQNNLVFQAVLESDLELPTKRVEHFIHFTALVHLIAQNEIVPTTPVIPPTWTDEGTLRAEEIYKLYFHGPSFQLIDAVSWDGMKLLGKMKSNLLPPVNPPDHTLLTNPLISEFCLQTAGVYMAGAQQLAGLPTSIEKLVLHPLTPDGTQIYAEVTPVVEAGGSVHFDIKAFDEKGRVYLEIYGFRTVTLPYSVEPEILAPFKAFISSKG